MSEEVDLSSWPGLHYAPPCVVVGVSGSGGSGGDQIDFFLNHKFLKFNFFQKFKIFQKIQNKQFFLSNIKKI